MQNSKRILVITDGLTQNCELASILRFIDEDFDRIDAKQASTQLKRHVEWKCVVLSGSTLDFETCQTWVSNSPELPFIFDSTLSDLQSLANAIGSLPNPLSYPELTQLLANCESYLRKKPNQAIHSAKDLAKSLIGNTQPMLDVRRMIEQVAPRDANVLVLGESGTGKEVVAQGIHKLSKRNKGPFVPVNCGAIPGELLESELFGHEKGAFTGAISARKGRFELAQAGTLFLDEIGDMPLQMQVKLLRVLQERQFERVGATKPIKADVRVIAATHRNLEDMVKEGKFREDLFYRLNVFPIETPSLRERAEDIPSLMHELIKRATALSGEKLKLTDNALESLKQHTWAGNVRELSNLVERLLILFPNQMVDVAELPIKYQHIDVQAFEPDYPEEMLERQALNDLFSDMNSDFEDVEGDFEQTQSTDTFSASIPPEGINLKEYLAELEVELINQALMMQDNVVARAAELLAMRRTTLVEKMRKYGISA